MQRFVIGGEAMATVVSDIEHQQFRKGQQFWTMADNSKWKQSNLFQ